MLIDYRLCVSHVQLCIPISKKYIIAFMLYKVVVVSHFLTLDF